LTDQIWERPSRSGQGESEDESERELRADLPAARHPEDACLPRDAWPRAAAEILKGERWEGDRSEDDYPDDHYPDDHLGNDLELCPVPDSLLDLAEDD
jgi:hypothetical protein